MSGAVNNTGNSSSSSSSLGGYFSIAQGAAKVGQGVESYMSNSSAANMAGQQKKVLNAQLALNAEDRKNQLNQLMGQQRADFGAVTGSGTYGTAGDVQVASAGQAGRDQYIDNINTYNQGQGYQQQANNDMQTGYSNLFGSIIESPESYLNYKSGYGFARS